MGNTPNPCDTCGYCGWNAMLEDNPNDDAWCDKKLKMGVANCPSYKHWGEKQNSTQKTEI